MYTTIFLDVANTKELNKSTKEDINLSSFIKKKRKMKSYIYLLGLILINLTTSCKVETKEWSHVKTIDLGSTTPIGLTAMEGHLWVADGDNNQLVHLDSKGKVLFKEEGFERPMHITSDGESIYVPEYGKDQITIFKGSERTMLKLVDTLDAPAGIHIGGKHIAIADFYNHRILFSNGNDWISFGKEGKSEGEFYYPTDVHIAHQKIYVADAYNNRVQVFDFEGNYLSSIGKEEKINAATGIFVSASQIFITDFENDRVLIFDLEGQLVQQISDGLDKPTDILLDGDLLYIANYKGKNLMTYKID